MKKAEAKSNFSLAQNNLQGPELISRREILNVLESLDKWSEIAMDMMSELSDFYVADHLLEKNIAIIDEMEVLENDYSKASEVAWDLLHSHRLSESPSRSKRTQKAAVNEVNILTVCTKESTTASEHVSERSQLHGHNTSIGSNINRDSVVEDSSPKYNAMEPNEMLSTANTEIARLSVQNSENTRYRSSEFAPVFHTDDDKKVRNDCTVTKEKNAFNQMTHDAEDHHLGLPNNNKNKVSTGRQKMLNDPQLGLTVTFNIEAMLFRLDISRKMSNYSLAWRGICQEWAINTFDPPEFYRLEGLTSAEEAQISTCVQSKDRQYPVLLDIAKLQWDVEFTKPISLFSRVGVHTTFPFLGYTTTDGKLAPANTLTSAVSRLESRIRRAKATVDQKCFARYDRLSLKSAHVKGYLHHPKQRPWKKGLAQYFRHGWFPESLLGRSSQIVSPYDDQKLEENPVQVICPNG
ncbi:MAG: hypothetical protein AB2693_25490, partial [Candidatus Thiodiazotropha sp.]